MDTHHTTIFRRHLPQRAHVWKQYGIWHWADYSNGRYISGSSLRAVIKLVRRKR